MKNSLRIAHTSDIHLDTDYYGGETNIASKDYCRSVFRALLDRIVALKPHLLLLPGDLFDSNRSCEETILWAMKSLAELPFPVVMIPGNHDNLEPDGIYRRFDFSELPNVSMLTAAEGEGVELAELQATVWGRGMKDHMPQFRPLEGLPPPREGWWNLALGHGIFVGRGENRFRSSPVETGQIEASRYDYIALGHHHALLNVSANGTAAYYSGAPIPISDESQGTFLMVELEEGDLPRVTLHTLD